MSENVTRRVALVRGSSSLLATVVGLDGELIVDQDKKTVTVHDGEKLGGYALLREDGDGAAVTVAGRPLADRFGERINVKDGPFHAKGNGVADDTGAINAAVLAAAATGKPLYFPAGVYMVGYQLSWSAGLGSLCLIGDGLDRSIIRRSAASTTNYMVFANVPKLYITGVAFDANKAENARPCDCFTVYTACNDLSLDNCAFMNAKAVNGYGTGLGVFGNSAGGTTYRVIDCRITGHDGVGLTSPDFDNVIISRNYVADNGRNGIQVASIDPAYLQKHHYVIVSDNICANNGGSGISCGNFLEDNVLDTTPVYGHGTPDTVGMVVSGNICYGNLAYGLAISGDNVAVTGNVVMHNGTTVGGFGGVLLNGRFCTLSDNSIRFNGTYGLDAGGSEYCTLSGNTIVSNGFAGWGTGANLGGTVGVVFVGNLLKENGGPTSYEVSVQNVETDAIGWALPELTRDLSIRGNTIWLVDTRLGVHVQDGARDIDVVDNMFRLTGSSATAANAIKFVGKRGNIKDNTVSTTADPLTINPDGNGILWVPDVLDTLLVTSSTTINAIQYQSAGWVGAKGIAWIEVTNGGSGYTSSPTVVVTGDGTGAQATAFIDGSGKVKGVRVSQYGTNYTTATVSFSGGGGSGATATAQIGLPLVGRRELTIHFNAACTIKRNGPPVVLGPSGADLAAANTSTLTLQSIYGQWRAKALAGVT